MILEKKSHVLLVYPIFYLLKDGWNPTLLLFVVWWVVSSMRLAGTFEQQSRKQSLHEVKDAAE